MIVPLVVTRPIELFAFVNHNAPSGPAMMPPGPMPGSPYTVTIPAVVIRPSSVPSENHNAPSGPAAIPNGPEMTVRR